MTELTAERLKELLDYDPETGGFTWKVDRGPHKVGGAAGVVARGYVHIRVDYRLYRANRLAWLFMTGEFPATIVDHENTDKTDNRWGNLRLADKAQNAWNTKGRPGRGHKGVCMHKASGLWHARVMVRGRVKSVGYFKCLEDADRAVRAAREQLHGEFARHE